MLCLVDESWSQAIEVPASPQARKGSSRPSLSLTRQVPESWQDLEVVAVRCHRRWRWSCVAARRPLAPPLGSWSRGSCRLPNRRDMDPVGIMDPQSPSLVVAVPRGAGDESATSPRSFRIACLWLYPVEPTANRPPPLKSGETTRRKADLHGEQWTPASLPVRNPKSPPPSPIQRERC
ncbi:hypothetical protein PR202_gb11422 [Eleusine coracana subsp. coracana]|uniref:Uncharacterized protein n=1 Tax=Eleusine coracana subsp. coracana TaxID=191504 RepID=A0AAV5EK69_ELECO|nr:hypothetical protein PR202_gb11422 [Eleusine coracana subsp. coracana]